MQKIDISETKPKNKQTTTAFHCNGIVIHLPDVVGDDVDGNGYSDDIGDDGDGDVDCCGVVVGDIDDNDDDDDDDGDDNDGDDVGDDVSDDVDDDDDDVDGLDDDADGEETIK